MISIKILELLLCPNFEIFGQINLNRIFLNLFDFPLKYLIFIIIEILPDFLRLLFHLVTVINGLVDVHSHQIGNRHWSGHEYFLNYGHPSWDYFLYVVLNVQNLHDWHGLIHDLVYRIVLEFSIS